MSKTQTVQPVKTEPATAEPEAATPQVSPTQFDVCCPAISNQRLRVNAGSPEEAQAAYREACQGLSPDAELDVKPVA